MCKKTPKGVPKAFGEKYLDDAMGECNEMIVNLEQSSDIYKFEPHTMSMEELIDLYDKSGRQLYNLSTAWTKFKSRG